MALSLLEAGLVDEFHLHIAPKVLGDNDARPLFDGRTPLELDEALSLRLVRMEPCGEDGHLIFRPVRCMFTGIINGQGKVLAVESVGTRPGSDSGALQPRGHYFGRIHCRQRNVSYSRNVWSEPFFRLCVR